jgi:HEPN domain-containing protein
MSPSSSDWVEKAEEDFHASLTLSRMRRPPLNDAVCFHAQQCVEKYLKARLLEAEIDFPRSYDLVLLLDLLHPVEPLWEPLRDRFSFLSASSVTMRYPGMSATTEMAKEALQICTQVRALARAALHLND